MKYLQQLWQTNINTENMLKKKKLFLVSQKKDNVVGKKSTKKRKRKIRENEVWMANKYMK